MNGTIPRAFVDAVRRALGDWTWNAVSRRYHDKRTGQFLSVEKHEALRNDVAAKQLDAIRGITDKLNAGELTPKAWEAAMQAQIKSNQTVMYAYGRGGVKQMRKSDREALGAMVGDQYEYLGKFRAQIDAGELSEKQIAARADQYGRASIAAHEAGKAAAHQISLPAYPGDGSSECHGNCLCSWRIVSAGDNWEATWTTHGKDPCPTCTMRAIEWSPLVIAKSKG